MKKPWDYSFFEKERGYYLTVLCGSSAMYEITIKLTEEEEKVSMENGESFIDEFARKIQFSPNDYLGRNQDSF